jgi:hypothetical protein
MVSSETTQHCGPFNGRFVYCGVQVSATIFTVRASTVGLVDVDGFIDPGSGDVVLAARSALSRSFTGPVTSIVWPTCSMRLIVALGMMLSVVADATAAGMVVEPDVPTAPAALLALALSLHFRSDKVKLSGESPAFKQPVTVTDFAGDFDSTVDGWNFGAGVWGGAGDWAESPAANVAARNVPVSARFIE